MFCIKVRVALSDQVDGSLIEGCGLQDLLHGDCLQFVWVQLFTLVWYAIVHDNGQRTHASLLIICPSFLRETERERDKKRCFISILSFTNANEFFNSTSQKSSLTATAHIVVKK